MRAQISSAQSRRNSTKLLPDLQRREELHPNSAKSLWRDVADAAARAPRRLGGRNSGAGGHRLGPPHLPAGAARGALRGAVLAAAEQGVGARERLRRRTSRILLPPLKEPRRPRGARAAGGRARVARAAPRRPPRRTAAADGAGAALVGHRRRGRRAVRDGAGRGAGARGGRRRRRLAQLAAAAGDRARAAARRLGRGGRRRRLRRGVRQLPDGSGARPRRWRRSRAAGGGRRGARLPRGARRGRARGARRALAAARLPFRAAARRDRWVPRREGGAVLCVARLLHLAARAAHRRVGARPPRARRLRPRQPAHAAVLARARRGDRVLPPAVAPPHRVAGHAVAAAAAAAA